MEEPLLSIHFQPCAQPCPSSVPAPDPRPAYLMDSLGDTLGLLGQAPLVQSQVVCRKPPSWCYLLLPPGPTVGQAPDKCHLHPNKWLSWFQNRQCASPISQAISYHRLSHMLSSLSPHSTPWLRKAIKKAVLVDCWWQALWKAPSFRLGHTSATCDILTHIWCWLPNQAVAQALPGCRLSLNKLICSSNPHSTPPLKNRID